MATTIITERDYISSCRLFLRWTRQRVVGYAAILSVTAAVSFALCTNGLRWHSGALIVGVVGGCIGGEVARWMCVPFFARRIYRQQRGFREPVEVSWDVTGIKSTSMLGAVTTPWEHFRDVRENDRVFILLLSDVLYRIVPKTAFSSVEDLAQFRNVAQAHIAHVADVPN